MDAKKLSRFTFFGSRPQKPQLCTLYILQKCESKGGSDLGHPTRDTIRFETSISLGKH